MMELVPFAPRHLGQIAALERENFSIPWDEDALESELENPLAFWLVAEEAGRVLGYVGSQTCFGETDVLNLAVAPEARRQGLGRTLMEALESRLLEKGVTQITLEVRPSNAPAVGLYMKLGYRQVGLRRGYYEKPREDALILQKSLITDHRSLIT